MIDGIESYYQQIADSIVDAISDEWTLAIVEATFYPDSIDYDAEYLRKADGRPVSFSAANSGYRAFREMRKKFKEAGKPLWGKARFELREDGKFDMKLGYENCDDNGDTIFDAEQWHKENAERRKHLGFSA